MESQLELQQQENAARAAEAENELAQTKEMVAVAESLCQQQQDQLAELAQKLIDGEEVQDLRDRLHSAQTNLQRR